MQFVVGVVGDVVFDYWFIGYDGVDVVVFQFFQGQWGGVEVFDFGVVFVQYLLYQFVVGGGVLGIDGQGFQVVYFVDFGVGGWQGDGLGGYEVGFGEGY